MSNINKLGNHSFDYQPYPSEKKLSIVDKSTQKIATLILSNNNFRETLSWTDKLWNATIGVFFKNHKWVKITPDQGIYRDSIYVYAKAMQNLQFIPQYRPASKTISPKTAQAQAEIRTHTAASSTPPQQSARTKFSKFPPQDHRSVSSGPSTPTSASSQTARSSSPVGFKSDWEPLPKLSFEKIEACSHYEALRDLACATCNLSSDCSELELLSALTEKRNFLETFVSKNQSANRLMMLEEKLFSTALPFLGGVSIKDINQATRLDDILKVAKKMTNLRADAPLYQIDVGLRKLSRMLSRNAPDDKETIHAMFYLKVLSDKLHSKAFMSTRSSIVNAVKTNPAALFRNFGLEKTDSKIFDAMRFVKENLNTQADVPTEKVLEMKALRSLYLNCTIPFLGVTISDIDEVDTLDQARSVLCKIAQLDLSSSDEALLAKLEELLTTLDENASSDLESKIAREYLSEAFEKFQDLSRPSAPEPRVKEPRISTNPFISVTEEDVNEAETKEECRDLLIKALKLTPESTESDIKKAHRSMILKTHPDKTDNLQAHAAFKLFDSLFKKYNEF